jgi:hypothetical protein
VHTGKSIVGAVGEGDARDFTALGDTVNTAEQLCGRAAPGEIAVSGAAAAADGLDTTGLEGRRLELAGAGSEHRGMGRTGLGGTLLLHRRSLIASPATLTEARRRLLAEVERVLQASMTLCARLRAQVAAELAATWRRRELDCA